MSPPRIRPASLLGALAAVALCAHPSAGSGQATVDRPVEPLVDARWLADRLDDPGVVVLHATRGSQRFEDGHVPGARPLPLDRIAWSGPTGAGTELRDPADVADALAEAGVRDGQHIVVYSADALGAARAWFTLDAMGLGDRASLLDGGLPAWRAAGLPEETGRVRVPRGSVRLAPRPEAVVDADWIVERLGGERLALVDARPDDEYTGEDGGMGGRVRPGHIPGAHQLYWPELVEDTEVWTLRPTPELRALFAGAGVEPGDTVVTYCMVGLRASMTYFVARMLGYETRLYDGSWRDWGARDDVPVVTGDRPGG